MKWSWREKRSFSAPRKDGDTNMPRTARTADIHQDRQLAVLLDLALRLGRQLTDRALLEAGATPAQVGRVANLLRHEPACSRFLRQPLVSAGHAPPLRFGEVTPVLEYSADGPRLRDH